MHYPLILLKLVVGLSIINVWLIQPNKATRWRGGDAKSIFEEFEVYGLPRSFCYLIGFLKVSLALLLIASIYYKQLTLIGSLGLGLLLLGSIAMHIKIKDPMYKSFPAFLFLIFNLIIASYAGY